MSGVQDPAPVLPVGSTCALADAAKAQGAMAAHSVRGRIAVTI